MEYKVGCINRIPELLNWSLAELRMADYLRLKTTLPTKNIIQYSTNSQQIHNEKNIHGNILTQMENTRVIKTRTNKIKSKNTKPTKRTKKPKTHKPIRKINHKISKPKDILQLRQYKLI